MTTPEQPSLLSLKNHLLQWQVVNLQDEIVHRDILDKQMRLVEQKSRQLEDARNVVRELEKKLIRLLHEKESVKFANAISTKLHDMDSAVLTINKIHDMLADTIESTKNLLPVQSNNGDWKSELELQSLSDNIESILILLHQIALKSNSSTISDYHTWLQDTRSHGDRVVEYKNIGNTIVSNMQRSTYLLKVLHENLVSRMSSKADAIVDRAAGYYNSSNDTAD